MMPFCCECGTQVDIGDRFCSNCGSMQLQRAGERVIQKRGHYNHVHVNREGRSLFGTTAKLLMVVFLIFISLFVYSNYFFPKPDKVVENLFISLNRLDINTAVSCLDPTIEKAYIATGNITGGLLGINLVDVMGLMPIMPYLSDLSGHELEQINFQVEVKSVEINGQKVGGFFDNLLFMLNHFVNIYGDEAIVYVEVYEPGANMRDDIAFQLEHFNNYGWRIMNAYPASTD